MTEISKIDLLKIDAKLKARKNLNQQPISKAKFEDQLLQTVKKLETMGNEVNAMMESSGIQAKNKLDISGNHRKEFLNSIDSVVENFSAAGKSSLKTAKTVAAQYGSMNKNKPV
ncbi:hypothetical protein KJ966_06150 [bacterium]|nr:hypothetical protein [bacterium]